ncbi:hypothetical protein O181_059586 [Austropuccinia psidii MF-1]|uniref:Uncharacterized protein n=1 Tax=Austropuccinia psidii MF-1 TaxID=1389203 RepID=A0A9Q3ECH0_9BASI|nr:hypothetical protein [Austropuccinia psidii MF-1]
MENPFEGAFFNSDKDKPLTWFLKQKERLSASHPDMSDSMINMKILRKFRGELEHAIKCRFVEACSTEYYINAMEYIITMTKAGKTQIENPVESKIIPKISREDKKPVFKFHKCGSTSNLCAKEKEEYDQDYEFSEETPVEDYAIQNITALFGGTEVHTHLPQYSEYFYNLINIQYARMCKTKTARGKGYTARESFITLVLMNDVEAKVNLDTGVFCTCIGKY